jgi:Sulfotransferase domain
VIVGAQKAGTSSLFAHLAGLAEVGAPERKEVHFFDRHHGEGVDWYARQFPATPDLVVGEATPYYLFHPLAIDRMQTVLPDAKVIVLLRDPRARAVSHYWHEVRLGVEPLDLEDALEAEDERLAGEEDRIRADPDYRGFAHQHFSYVARGRYVGQLRRLLAAYPRAQVSVLHFEDLVADPVSTLAGVHDFLGLPPLDPAVVLPERNRGDYEPAPALARLEQEFAGWESEVDEVLTGD